MAKYRHWKEWADVTVLHPNVTLLGQLYTYCKICENGWEMQKTKMCSGVLCVTFSSPHFTPGSAFIRKFKGFCGLFFRGTNKTRNSHEMRKVYSECFVFCGVFHEYTREMRKMYSQPKAGYTLIISRVSIRLCTISWTISWDWEPIILHFSQYRRFRSPWILRETWWETCHIVLFNISWKYHSPGENSDTQDEKNDWRYGLRNVIYTFLVSLVTLSFFRILINLTISV